MELREKAVIELEIEDSQSSGRTAEIKEDLKDINKALRDLKESGEVGSEAWKDLKTQQRELNSELKDLKHNIDINDASLDDLNDALRYWQKEAKAAKVDSEEWIEASKKAGEIKSRINDVTEEMRELGGLVDKQASEGGIWSNWKAQALAVFTGAGLLELAKSAGQAFLDFGMDIFETTAKFEKYDAVLTNALGSQEAATAAMDKIKTLAASTPFSVDELTESYVKYVNRGLQPSMAEMTKLGDIAASQGKSFDQLTEAVLDAGTGEFERLKEFGIQASKNGDEVSLAFKGVQKTVENTPEAIQGALIAFGELEGVQGGMAAISQTLEGRVSNLGDSFDALMLILGDVLYPVFSSVLSLMSGGIAIFSDLLSGNISLSESSTFLGGVFDALGTIMKTLWTIVSNVVEIGVELFGTIAKIIDNAIGLSGQGNILTGVLNLVSGALRVVGSVAIAALTGVQALADGLLILQNKGKEVANFFGADFKIDPKATFDNLKNNAETNFKRIQDLWAETNDKGVKSTEAAVSHTTQTHQKGQETQTATEKKEAEKRQKEAEKLAKDKEKAESDLQKKLEDMQVKAIADDTQRKIAAENLNYNRELANINKSIASEDTKQKTIEQLKKTHQANLDKIDADAQKKADKDRDDTLKKEAAARKKTEDEEKKARETKRKLDQDLLDKGFQAEISRANLDLALAKKNSAEMWAAKKAILDIEAKHKSDKLKAEAEAEKARIAESIADNIQKAAAIQNIDSALANKLKTIETQLATDKKKIDADQLAERKKKTDEFYGALNSAMSGDMNAFINFIRQKAAADGKYLSERNQAFVQHTQQIGALMTTAVNQLIELSKSYTEKQINNLTKEKNENFKKLDDEYKKGVITKEQLDAEKTKLQEKFDADGLELKKKEFERSKKLQIASALIAGSMAILSALATPPFPLGLAMAVVAGVKTAFDIKKIKSQQFEARDGYVSNAGILEGGRHGSSYGQGGIAMYDRLSGREVGEAEGGEAFMILSRETTKNNLGLIRRLMDSSLNRNGAPILANGGIVPIASATNWLGEMWRNGALKMWENGTIEGVDMNQSSSPEATAAIAENKKISEQMEKNTKATAENTEKIIEYVNILIGVSRKILEKPSGISLHDLHNAMNSAVAASKRSNM